MAAASGEVDIPPHFGDGSAHVWGGPSRPWRFLAYQAVVLVGRAPT